MSFAHCDSDWPTLTTTLFPFSNCVFTPKSFTHFHLKFSPHLSIILWNIGVICNKSHIFWCNSSVVKLSGLTKCFLELWKESMSKENLEVSRSPGKLLLKTTYKNLKKVCYLGSKRKINQGLLETFALCCILSCYCVLCLSVRTVMSASTAPTRQETSSWNCTTGVSTSPAGAPTRSDDRRLLKSCSLFHPDTVQSEWDSVEL